MDTNKKNDNVRNSSTAYAGGLSMQEARELVGDVRLVKLSSNENPLGPSARVIAAMAKAAKDSHRYPPRTDDQLREALALHHGQGLSREHFFTANSGSEAIEFVYRQLVSAGDNVIVCSPSFRLYQRFNVQYGAETRDVPLRLPNFSLDVQQILRQIDARTRLVVIINPNNPTGTIAAQAAQLALLASLPPHVTLLADEVYHNFVESPHYLNLVPQILQRKNIIRIQSFSKAYGMGGLRVGYGMTMEKMAEQLRQLQRPFHINAIAMAGALAALDDDAYVQAGIGNNVAGRAFLYEALDRLGVRYWPSQTNFILLQTDLLSSTLTEKMLQKGVMVRDPRDPMIPNSIRVTVGLPEENQAFIQALDAVLSDEAI